MFFKVWSSIFCFLCPFPPPPSKKIQGISIEFEGKARVHWSEERTTGTGEDRRTETVHYDSEVRDTVQRAT